MAPDLSVLESAVDYSAVVAAILNVAGVLVSVHVVVTVAKVVLRTVGEVNGSRRPAVRVSGVHDSIVRGEYVPRHKYESWYVRTAHRNHRWARAYAKRAAEAGWWQ